MFFLELSQLKQLYTREPLRCLVVYADYRQRLLKSRLHIDCWPSGVTKVIVGLWRLKSSALSMISHIRWIYWTTLLAKKHGNEQSTSMSTITGLTEYATIRTAVFESKIPTCGRLLLWSTTPCSANSWQRLGNSTYLYEIEVSEWNVYSPE